MKNTKDIAEALAAPFDIADIEFVGRGNGKRIVAAPYVTNRAIMTRLDSVVGIANWKNEFATSPTGGGVLCGLSIRIDGEWITKWDGAENTQIESVKGGLSGAMKRAAVQWGIGRFLYDSPRLWVTADQYSRGGKTLSKLGATGEKEARAMMKEWLDGIMRPYPVMSLLSKLRMLEKRYRYKDAGDANIDGIIPDELMKAIFGEITNGAIISAFKWITGSDVYAPLELDSLYEHFGVDKQPSESKTKEGEGNGDNEK